MWGWNGAIPQLPSAGLNARRRAGRQGLLPSLLGLVATAQTSPGAQFSAGRASVSSTSVGVHVYMGFYVLFFFPSPQENPQNSAFCLYQAVGCAVKPSLSFACSLVGSGCLSGRGRGTVGAHKAVGQSEGCADPCVLTKAVSRRESHAESRLAGEGTGRWRNPAANR